MSDEPKTSGFQFTPKKHGLAAMLDQHKANTAEVTALQNTHNSKEIEKPFEYSSPVQATDKIRIIFDDSGSMSGQKIKDAIEGTIEFMRNCVINQTAVAVHPMNYVSIDTTSLSTDLPALSILIKNISASNYTPLFQTWAEAQEAKPKATRYIIFSDGQPDTKNKMEECISFCIENKVPCDTVYIAEHTGESMGARLLKEIADKTGGIFLQFDRTKVNFKTAFKYLAPTLRLQLAASVDMQKQLQEGKLK